MKKKEAIINVIIIIAVNASLSFPAISDGAIKEGKKAPPQSCDH